MLIHANFGYDAVETISGSEPPNEIWYENVSHFIWMIFFAYLYHLDCFFFISVHFKGDTQILKESRIIPWTHKVERSCPLSMWYGEQHGGHSTDSPVRGLCVCDIVSPTSPCYYASQCDSILTYINQYKGQKRLTSKVHDHLAANRPIKLPSSSDRTTRSLVVNK